MISTKHLTVRLKDIPSAWGFQYYLKLTEVLTGQSVKMHSVFNKEKTPSMHIYLNESKNEYRFKCFSSGKGGNIVELVKEMHSLDDTRAIAKIISDYNEFVITKGEFKIQDFKSGSRYRVTDYTLRQWYTNDAEYWMPYGIGSKLLEEYNIKPLKRYVMSKNDDSLIISHDTMYGYFKSDGTLYKVYSPKIKKKKFIKVKDYLQGLDQLKYDKPYLVICSSLKDALCFKLLGFNTEVIAPDSENSIIKASLINLFKERYEKIITLFDNDDAGRRSIQKYEQIYNIPGTFFPLEKDVADAIVTHGIKEVKKQMIPVLESTLIKYVR
jgi:DNA primase